MSSRMDYGSDKRVSDEVIEFLKGNYQRNVRLRDVARAVYMSPHHMNRRFKEEVGCTIMKYLTRVRIERAKGLLSDDRLSISDVMRRVGYTEPSHFTKAFKRVEGMPPKDFRECLWRATGKGGGKESVLRKKVQVERHWM